MYEELLRRGRDIGILGEPECPVAGIDSAASSRSPSSPSGSPLADPRPLQSGTAPDHGVMGASPGRSWRFDRVGGILSQHGTIRRQNGSHPSQAGRGRPP